MIHVATQEDVLGPMAAGWGLWGKRENGRRGFTYWLRPVPGQPYQTKRVSARIIAALESSGQISGAQNAYGDMIYQLGGQTTLLGADA